MNPFRLDVLGLTLLLSAPVLASGGTGGMDPGVAATRVLICWVVATIGAALLKSYFDAAKEEAERRARIKAELDALTAEADEEDEQPLSPLRDPMREPMHPQNNVASADEDTATGR